METAKSIPCTVSQYTEKSTSIQQHSHSFTYFSDYVAVETCSLSLSFVTLISSLLLHPTLQMMGKTDGDNYTLDDMFVSSAAQEEGEGREEERMRNRAIRESRRMAASMDKCQHCFSSQELQKHLVVAIGSKVSA